MDGQRQNRDGYTRDRLQVPGRVVERPDLDQRLVEVRKRAAEQNGVAVGLRTRDRGGPQRAAAAAHVLDHDRAEQRLHLLRPWTPDQVVCAAGRKRNHELDRSLGIALRARDR